MNQSLVDFKGRLTEEGYSFTEEELLSETELSDAELASAAGGLTASISGGLTPYHSIAGR